MGQYFLVVNTAKRQYLDAGRFGENIKRSGILRGKHAAALGLLLCDATQPEGAHTLFGSWAGDPIAVTGDYAPPNSASVPTSTVDTPTKNLYALANDEYEDISRQAMLMLIADDEEWAESFVRDIDYTQTLLIELGQLALSYRCEPVRRALEKALGTEWRKEYKKACSQWAGRRYRVSTGKSGYRLEVADILEVPDLTKELKKAELDATIEFFTTEFGVSDSQTISLGANVPPAIAVRAIQVASRHWPFLCYVRLTSDLKSPPDFIHDEIHFGSHSGKEKTHPTLRPWSESDFSELNSAMSLSQLHDFIRKHR